MKFSDLLKIMKEYNIPDDVHIVSDSEWECYPSEVETIVYFKYNNLMVLKQQFYWDADDFEEMKEEQLEYLGKFSRLRKFPDTDYTEYITDDNLDAIIIDLKENKTYEFTNEEIEKLAKEDDERSEAHQKELEKYSEDEVLSSDGWRNIMHSIMDDAKQNGEYYGKILDELKQNEVDYDKIRRIIDEIKQNEENKDADR